jgi:hypothetical protein
MHTLQDVTQESFDALVVLVVDEFAKKQAIAEDVKTTLTNALKATWHEMETLALEEKEDEKV